MADMVAETWTRARGVAERAFGGETRQLRVGARARAGREWILQKSDTNNAYKETKNIDKKTMHKRRCTVVFRRAVGGAAMAL
jgi:hypothetical protein